MRRLFLIMAMLLAVAAVAVETVPFVPVQAGPNARAVDVPTHATDRLLIQFAPGQVPADLARMPQTRGVRTATTSLGKGALDNTLAAAGLTAVSRPYDAPRRVDKAVDLGVDRWFMLEFSTDTELTDLATQLRKDPAVAAVSLDWRAFPAAVPSDPLYVDHWGHNNTGQLPSYDWGSYSHTGPLVGTVGFDANAESAWDASQGYGDAGVIIAILDSGVDIDHPDLNLISGYDFGDNDTNPDDNSGQPGHGTCCAGVAAGVQNNLGAVGIAAACSIMPCKVADSGGSMYFSYIQNALYWAADNGADIISMSLGAPISSDPATDAALQYAYDAGVVILAATGNENDSTISYPAIHAAVIGVGAASPCGDRKRSSSSYAEVNSGVSTDPNGYTCDGERWWGSNYGSTTRDAAGAVDILAPTILPTTDIGGNGGYVSGDYEPYFNGTSCATPYAAGVAGLVISANPSYSPAQVRDALVSTAIDVVNVESGTGWDRYSGYGMVDAAAAVGGGGPVAPVADFHATPTSGAAPLTVVFGDLSSGGPTSWSWNFGDGGTSSAQNPSHTYTEVGTYDVSLTVTNDVGGDSLTRNGYITVTEPGVTTFVTAGGESSITGSQSGSYIDTAADDGVMETLTEALYTGHPRKRYSYLEHQWSFNLPSGGEATFHLSAARTANSEGDDFVFEYSTDGVNWTGLVTVASATEQAFTVGCGSLAGAVTVRVYDSDRNWGNEALDDLLVDFMAFEVGDVQPEAPTAAFAGTPVSGEAPLNVVFTDQSTGSPTSWSWTFGDGGTSTAQNPSHTYNTPGTYTVTLVAANDIGSDTVTRTDYITVTEPGTGGDTLHVAAMNVSRKNAGPNVNGLCDVTVVDDAEAAVEGASVTVAYDGPNGGSLTGVTGANGVVSFSTPKLKNPSGEWCFEVVGITHASLTYDSGANVVTRACESGVVYGADEDRMDPVALDLAQNHPNPFNPMTEISFSLPREAQVRLAIYDVSGARVATLVDGVAAAGTHSARWDARDRPSGVYFYRLQVDGQSLTRKMILLK